MSALSFFRRLVLWLLPLFASALSLAADNYPTRNARFIVPFAPGGTNDVLARLFGSRPEAFAHTLQSEIKRWREVIRAAGIERQ